MLLFVSQAVGVEGVQQLGADEELHPFNLSMHFLCWLAARCALLLDYLAPHTSGTYSIANT